MGSKEDSKATQESNMCCNLDPAKAKEISFTVQPEQDWKDIPIEAPKGKDFGPNIKHSHASYYAPYTGDMEGWAVHNYIMTMSGEGDNGRCDWAGQALFSGTICGRKGTVAIAQWGVCVGDKLTNNWGIIDETATGELVGVKGGGSFDSPAKPGIAMPGKLMVQCD